MDKRERKRLRRPTTRRLVQLYAALLYNANLKGFVKGEIYTGKTKGLCVPGLNCYSCPAAVGACPLGALQNAVAASAKRPAFYVIGLLLLFGLTLGRTICGWLCPFGLIQELLHKIPSPKLKKGRLTRALSWVKYVLLAVLALGIPLYFAFRQTPLPAFCKYVCPAGTLEGALALILHPNNGALRDMLGPLFAGKLTILILTLIACVFIYRPFCRFLCPLGALYSLMTRLALVGVKLDRERCTDCGVCRAICPVDIRRVGDRECVACGKCIDRCPEAAIRFRAGKIVLAGFEATGNRQQATGDGGREATGNRQQATGNSGREATGNRQQATGNRGREATGNRQQATGDGGREATGNRQQKKPSPWGEGAPVRKLGRMRGPPIKRELPQNGNASSPGSSPLPFFWGRWFISTSWIPVRPRPPRLKPRAPSLGTPWAGPCRTSRSKRLTARPSPSRSTGGKS